MHPRSLISVTPGDVVLNLNEACMVLNGSFISVMTQTPHLIIASAGVNGCYILINKDGLMIARLTAGDFVKA
jgi:hypothetical protein